MLLGLSPPYPIERALETLKKGRHGAAGPSRSRLGWPWNSRPILLSGAPRTGTSWTAKVLSRPWRVRYLREPVSHGGFDPVGESARYPYLVAGDEASHYADVWKRAAALPSMIRKRWLLMESNPWVRRLPIMPARLLIKEVNCPLALDWLADVFRMQIVVTVRHPCGFVASGLRVLAKGFPFVSLDHLLSQPRLVATYFVEEYDWLSQIQDPVSQLAAWYGAIYKVLADQLLHHPDWILVQHEGFCADPQTHFRRLFKALGMHYTGSIDRFLAATSNADDGELYSVCRRTSTEPEKWKRELTSEQIDTVAAVVSRFRLPFYREFA